MRIEAYARNANFALLWDIPGYYELFIGYRIVAVSIVGHAPLACSHTQMYELPTDFSRTAAYTEAGLLMLTAHGPFASLPLLLPLLLPLPLPLPKSLSLLLCCLFLAGALLFFPAPNTSSPWGAVTIRTTRCS